MPSRDSILIAVTLGDVNGIGPEVALRAAWDRRAAPGARVVLVGDAAAAAVAARRCRLPAPPAVPDPASPFRGRVALWTPPGSPRVTLRPGRVRVDAARAAAHWIAAAVRGCLDGVFAAMVTAPICKEGLARAGIPFPGHTEMIAGLTGTRRFAMMLCGGGLRVVLATRHLPLRRVPRAVTRAAVTEAAAIASEALPWLGARAGGVAVCGLNPHAGDGGALGREEIDVIAPAIRAARRRGLPVSGPYPADTVFHEALAGRHAAVVALYHDQGLAALKTVAFDTGVNVTLGLPVVRTSPDHGTAFGIAGRGAANPASMAAALRLAADLARRPNPWTRGRG
ncbi:MAG: 4-hydroxythreonine-4-phosphate dehydrogenase PdxA [Lentisphaerae bacterium]|nr:4-hydroxythreonine-4-phosphate dehydrogenase PdxA [Lentisphaerota bacterium]